MARAWTKDDELRLLSLIEDKKSPEEIASLLTRTASSIRNKQSKLGIKSKSRDKWSDEDILKCKTLRLKGLTTDQISIQLGKKESTVRHKIEQLLAAEELEPRYNEWDDQELLAFVREYKSTTALERARSVSARVPWPHTISKRFGSWKEALKLAGLPINISGMKQDKPTILYLVLFTQDYFYKVGLTQNSIRQRLKGYPKYEIIDSVEYNNLEDAFNTEQELLSLVEGYKFCPPKFNGYTECFRYPNKLENLESLYELYRRADKDCN